MIMSVHVGVMTIKLLWLAWGDDKGGPVAFACLALEVPE